jgi:hypothetical protein
VYIPALDGIEIARLIHSFFENWSLYFFEVLVACEFAELFVDEHNDWKKVRTISWDMTGPKYRVLFSLHSFIKIAGIASFALAIAMEFGAAETSASLDKVTDDDLAFSSKQTTAALKQAAEATRLGAKAEESNKNLGIDLEHEKQKTASSQKAESEARLALAQQVREQGPRWVPLAEASERLGKELSKFKQEIEVVTCGKPPGDNETYLTVETIIGPILGRNGAGWTITRLANENCNLAPYLTVIFNTKSNQETRDAANALAAGLHSVFPKLPETPIGLVPEMWVGMLSRMGPNGPYKVAFSHPNLVVLSIGAHP